MGGQRHAPAALLPGTKPGTHCTEGLGGGLLGRSGMMRKISSYWASTPGPLARSESLYRLRYPDPLENNYTSIKTIKMGKQKREMH